MAIKPHTIDIVVADMGKALAFYRVLGLNVPLDQDDEMQVEIVTPNAPSIGLVTEAAVRQSNPDWTTPIGQRVTFACKCDTLAEVDETYARVTAEGYTGLKEPWDAFWGQRYAFLQDPDGNRVDLFAPLQNQV
jgi:catechol 2,3-dioxygenase-like lactoylglutathione lyase family enzyme